MRTSPPSTRPPGRPGAHAPGAGLARLAATGASDTDIATHLLVSVRTVRTHLEHVYAKLDIHSRRELMAMGERLEGLIGRKG